MEKVSPLLLNGAADLQPYFARLVTPGSEQFAAAQKIVDFYKSSVYDIMVIDGYAGTGKTTLISAFVKFLVAANKSVVLLASTGRAGKILSDKAAFPVETIHKHIYVLKVQEVDKIRKTKKLTFLLRSCALPKDALIIVDESSMIADHAPKGVFLNYGTGKLLSDLVAYAGGRKMIFVGDSCQLPPVNVAFPPVFQNAYIENNLRKKVLRIKLTQQKRFPPESVIFRITDAWRRAIESNISMPIHIAASGENDIKVIGSQPMFGAMLANQIRRTGIENCIGVCFSNKAAFTHNQEVRKILFPNNSFIQKGEILIVIQNNYLHDITNGEHLIVDSIGSLVSRAGMGFRDFEGRVRDYAGYRTIRGKLIEEIIYQPEPSLSNENETELFIDFTIRMKAKGIKEDTEAFFIQQMTDPWLNAVRAKFGYVITCHRAQGGEWDDVFIDIENILPSFKPEFYLRWAYTAVSRSAKRLHFLKKSFVKD